MILNSENQKWTYSPLRNWRFPKISYSFFQDGELEGNSQDEKVEEDFLADKIRYFR